MERPRADVRLWAVLALVAVVFAPGLFGGYLSYDDDWMIRDNAFFQNAGYHSLSDIWFDFTPSTRLLLGAEYLPVRDTSVLLDTLVFGFGPGGMKAVNLLLYLCASFFCILSCRKLFGPGLSSDLLAALFLVHPVHAESVSWIVGRKDVLGLLFFWAALSLPRERSVSGSLGVAALAVLAQLSKFLFVATPLLLFVMDYAKDGAGGLKRSTLSLIPCFLGVAFSAAIQFHVAQTTSMVESEAAPYAQRLLTMGPVWWGYIKTAFLGVDLNVMHEVVPRTRIDAAVVLGYGSVLAVAILLSLLAARTHNRCFLAAWVCFFFPLLPAAQIFAPIQNYHADRYLLLSVLGVALTFVAPLLGPEPATPRFKLRWGMLQLGVLIWFSVHACYRSYLFADPVRLFSQATEATSYVGAAPFQLAHALQNQGKNSEAIVYYEKARARPDRPSEAGRRATNNLARMYVRQNNHAQAERVLREGLLEYPTDPKILGNLAEVLWMTGRRAEAKGLYERLVLQFPTYEPGKLNYLRHFGDGTARQR